VDAVPIEFTESSEIDIDELAAFSIQILSKENQLANLEQIMSSETSIGETRSNCIEELGTNESRSTWIENNFDLISSMAMDIETATVTPDCGDETDTESNHSHTESSSLPLVEAGFDLLPVPTSPTVTLSPAPSDVYYEDDIMKPNNTNHNIVIHSNSQFDTEKFDHFNLFLDTGYEITDRWDKADSMEVPLFPELE